MSINLRKKCPRCNTSMVQETAVCPNCQLNFNKFYQATNAEAKLAVKQGRKDDVLFRKGVPSDIKKWALLLITIFGGFFGLHYYYVGRNKMGIFFSLAFVVGVVNAIISIAVNTTLSGIVWELFSLLVLVWGAVIVMWIIDIAKVCLNKFKIPVSRS